MQPVYHHLAHSLTPQHIELLLSFVKVMVPVKVPKVQLKRQEMFGQMQKVLL